MLRSRPRRSVTNRAGAGVVAAASVALLLGGCVGVPGATPTPTAAPSPSPEPIFASDEEALAAAVEAYEAYRAVSAQISVDGGQNAARIEPYVSAEFATTMLSEFASLQKAGLRMEGTTTIDTTSLASWDSTANQAEVSIYLCRDVSGSRAINASGVDVTPPDRVDRQPLQAFLVSGAAGPGALVVDGVELWAGNNFCD